MLAGSQVPLGGEPSHISKLWHIPRWKETWVIVDYKGLVSDEDTDICLIDHIYILTFNFVFPMAK